MPLFTSDSNVTISLPPVAFDPSLWSTAAKQLNLKYLAEHPDVAAQLLQSGLSADAAALHILRLECEYRARHKTVMLMAMAKFPDGALTLENFDFSVSSLDESQFRSLAGLTWMQNHVNLLFWGDSGLGKTHLAVALGKIAIAEKGYSVRFIAANELMEMLETARVHGVLTEKLRLLNRNDLIIVDEFGYPLMADHPEYAALFYAFISSRYNKKSTILTTNRQVSEWPKYLGNDQKCCIASLDRFLHHSIRIHFTGLSYRLKRIREERLAGNAESGNLIRALDGE